MIAPAAGLLALVSARELVRAARGRTSCSGALALTAGTAASATAATVIARSMLSRVRSSQNTLDEVARTGRLDLRCGGDGADELGALERSVNDVLENFESVVRDVGEKSDTLLDSVEALDAHEQNACLAIAETAATADAAPDPPYPALAMQVIARVGYALNGLAGAFSVAAPSAGHARRFPRGDAKPYSY